MVAITDIVEDRRTCFVYFVGNAKIQVSRANGRRFWALLQAQQRADSMGSVVQVGEIRLPAYKGIPIVRHAAGTFSEEYIGVVH
jgi:hypothetical protein